MLDGGGDPRVITPPYTNAKRPAWLSTVNEIAFNFDQSSIWTVDLETDRIAPFLPDASSDALSFFHPCAYPNEPAVVVMASCETACGGFGCGLGLLDLPI